MEDVIGRIASLKWIWVKHAAWEAYAQEWSRKAVEVEEEDANQVTLACF